MWNGYGVCSNSNVIRQVSPPPPVSHDHFNHWLCNVIYLPTISASIGESSTQCFETTWYVECPVIVVSQIDPGLMEGQTAGGAWRVGARGVKGRHSISCRQAAVAQSNFSLIQTALKKSFWMRRHCPRSSSSAYIRVPLLDHNPGNATGTTRYQPCSLQ